MLRATTVGRVSWAPSQGHSEGMAGGMTEQAWPVSPSAQARPLNADWEGMARQPRPLLTHQPLPGLQVKRGPEAVAPWDTSLMY